MPVLAVLYLLLAALTATASAQELSTILAGQAQLSDFASALEQLPWLNNVIKAGNITVLAPTNKAFAAYNASNPLINDIHAILPYHILQGLHTTLSLNGTQFIPTLLNNSTYANVTGGQRVQVNQTSDGNITFYSALKDESTITTPDILIQSGFVQIVDTVLQPPLPLSQTVSLLDLPYLKGLLEAGGAFSGQELQQTAEFELRTDITYFVVNSPAFSLNYTGFENLTQAEILKLATYQLIEGTVAYSTLLTDGAKFKTPEGSDVTVTVQRDGTTFINDAKVVQKDFLINNGVMQVLDRLLNLNDTSARPPTISSGMTTGTKAGVGVGIAIAVLLVIAISAFFWIRSRKNRRAPTAVPADSEYKQPGYPTTSELSNDGWRGGLRYEMSGDAKRAVELEARGRPPVELGSRGLISGQDLDRSH